MVILIISLRKVFKLKVVLNFTNGDLKEVIKLSAPIYISVAIWEINAIINKMLASGLVEGSISAMNYADRLRELPNGVITAAVITVMFPLLSRYAAQKDFSNLKAATIKAITLLFMTLIPVIAVSIYYSGEITKIVYERGAFTPDTTALTASIFIFAVMSLFFSGGATLLSNTFYSMQDTKTPQIAAVIMVICNIILNIILVRYMQAAGLTLATSISFFIYFAILFILFRKKCGAFGGLALLKNIAKCTIATISMIPVFILCEIFRNRLPLIIFFGIGVIISLIVYAVLLYLLKVELFMETLNRAKMFFKNRRKTKNI
jgi:putative peptidoglycan lipid II flippase